MKQFLYFILIVLLNSCHEAKEKWPEYDKDSAQWKKPDKNNIVDIHHTSNSHDDVPWSSDYDSGYFKGSLPEKIVYPETIDTSNMLENFLFKNVNRKEIVFLNKETLSHSAYVDQKRKIWTDTLKNKDVTIVSQYIFGEKRAQRIYLNGEIIRDYKYTRIDTLREDIFSLSASSFRHFLFNGTEYYYIEAGIADCFSSSCTVDYFLLYDVKHKKLNEFSCIRVYENRFWGDINGDDKLDFLEIDNEAGYGISDTNHFRITLWSANKNGDFELSKDKNGREYFIEGNSGNDRYVDEMHIDKYYWPVKIIFP